MNHSLAACSFLPWLRRGIANEIQAADLNPNVLLRATVPVQLRLQGDAPGGGTVSSLATRDVLLFGPGDVVGIDRRAVVKTEPRHWVTNFEPNYLPYVEFYDEDFPWRYTPAAPDRTLGRLRPWIMLVVLQEEAEFSEGTNLLNRPLPYIECFNAATAFPPAEQLWAWAHVHVNRDLADSAEEIVSSDMDAVLPKLRAVLNENADLAYSRIVCPRKLDQNAAYHAFLVPVFESGRLAGLGLDPTKTPNATFSAWADYPAGRTKDEPAYFPYYYRWYFRTGTVGDFEYLVRLLKPKPADARVGRRDMDVQEPGANLRGITDAALGGVLKLGGALQIPIGALQPEDQAEVDKYENWDQPYPHDFQTGLAAYLNLADDYTTMPAGEANAPTGLNEPLKSDPDPVVTAPLYGRWHALVQRVHTNRSGADVYSDDNWVHELNLDPRFRVAAGFGTQVVQTNQEAYMDAAWEQVGQILEANRRIRLAQLAKEVTAIWYDRHLKPLAQANVEKALWLTAPVHKRVVAQGDKEEELVLVIRGELLKKFPTAVIYAHRARWQLNEDGTIDPQQVRLLEELTEGEEAEPPKTKVRTPLYEAKVEPDIYFLGFDLTAEEARGNTPDDPNPNPGWFIVIKEREGEPRFGLDIAKQPCRYVWNDLSWEDVLPGPPGSFLQITPGMQELRVAELTDSGDYRYEQWEEDKQVTWNGNMNAAQLAYVLYQMPVRIAVHASEMLPRA